MRSFHRIAFFLQGVGLAMALALGDYVLAAWALGWAAFSLWTLRVK